MLTTKYALLCITALIVSSACVQGKNINKELDDMLQTEQKSEKLQKLLNTIESSSDMKNLKEAKMNQDQIKQLADQIKIEKEKLNEIKSNGKDDSLLNGLWKLPFLFDLPSFGMKSVSIIEIPSEKKQSGQQLPEIVRELEKSLKKESNDEWHLLNKRSSEYKKAVGALGAQALFGKKQHHATRGKRQIGGMMGGMGGMSGMSGMMGGMSGMGGMGGTGSLGMSNPMASGMAKDGMMGVNGGPGFVDPHQAAQAQNQMMERSAQGANNQGGFGGMMGGMGGMGGSSGGVFGSHRNIPKPVAPLQTVFVPQLQYGKPQYSFYGGAQQGAQHPAPVQQAAPVLQQAAPAYGQQVVQQAAPAYGQQVVQQAAPAYGQQVVQQAAPAYQQEAPVQQAAAPAYGQQVVQQAAPAYQQEAPVQQAAAPAYGQQVVQQAAPAYGYGQQAVQQPAPVDPQQPTDQFAGQQQQGFGGMGGFGGQQGLGASAGFGAQQQSLGASRQLSASIMSSAPSFVRQASNGPAQVNPPTNDPSQLVNSCASGQVQPIWEGDQITESYCRCSNGGYGFTCQENFANPCSNGQQYSPADASVGPNYFIECGWGLPFLIKCAPGTIWNQAEETCDYSAVQQSAAAPSYGYSSSYGQQQQAAPAYTAPQQQATPAYTAPAVQAAPAYTAPQQQAAPAYSAPAVQQQAAPAYTAPVVQQQAAPAYTAPQKQTFSGYPAGPISLPQQTQAAPSYSAPVQTQKSSGY